MTATLKLPQAFGQIKVTVSGQWQGGISVTGPDGKPSRAVVPGPDGTAIAQAPLYKPTDLTLAINGIGQGVMLVEYNGVELELALQMDAPESPEP